MLNRIGGTTGRAPWRLGLCLLGLLAAPDRLHKKDFTRLIEGSAQAEFGRVTIYHDSVRVRLRTIFDNRRA